MDEAIKTHEAGQKHPIISKLFNRHGEEDSTMLAKQSVEWGDSVKSLLAEVKSETD